MRRSVSVTLEDLDPDERLVLVEKATARTYQKGDSLIVQGTPNDLLFVLSDGEVLVEQSLPVTARYVATAMGVFRERPDDSAPQRSNVAVTTLGPGAIFGDLSLLDGRPAGATITALEEVEVLVFGRDQLEEWHRDSPDFAAHVYRSIAKVIAYRLRRSLSPMD